MPMVRYQIRNEYALADPELYRSADREDPEALLEGVAMAGLVGVLRQLGDLAEFAAEIFHELHEEVLATAARGHGLILRVQQLEAEFPSVEKALLSQSSHSQFTYNAGTEWHANIRTDQNLITQGDMPRFILDSYEESRGPPRLFMLDKFDIAGAGACLKRYSDPSFFKTELASSGKVEPEFQREKKARKVKKKVSCWRNDEAVESSLAPHINYDFHPGTPNQVPDKNPTRRVKLKSRGMKGMDTSRIRSCLESLLEVHSSEQEVVLENSEDLSTRTVNSTVSAPMVQEILIDNSNMYLTSSNGNTIRPPNEQERLLISNELENQKINEVCFETLPEPFHEAQNCYPNLQTVDKNEMFINNGVGRELKYRSTETEKNVPVLDKASRKKLLSENEYTTEGFADDYRSDDIGSEMENYMDALNTMESEIETDSESRPKSDQTFFGVLNNTNKGPLTQISETNPIVESVVPLMLRSMSPKGISNSSGSDAVASLVAGDATEQSLVNFYMPSNSEINLDGDHDKASEELHITNKAIHFNVGTHLLHDKYSDPVTSVIPNTRPEIGDTYDSCVTESTSTITPVCPKGRSDKALSSTSESNKISSCYVKSNLDVAEDLDGTLPCIKETSEAQQLDDSSCGSRDIRGIIHPEEYDEELISEGMRGTIEMTDPISQKQEGSFYKQISNERVKHLFDEPEESRKQETETSEMESSVKPRHLSVEVSPEFFDDTLEVHNHSNGLTFEDTAITEKFHPMKGNEALEDVAGTIEISDGLSQTQRGIIFEKVTFGCVEDSPVPLTVHLGEPKDYIQNDTETCSGESISPNCPTASPLTNQFMQTTVLEAEIQSSIASGEDLPCSVNGEDTDDVFNSENISSNVMVDVMDHLSTEDEPEDLCTVESSKETSIAGTKLQSNCEVVDRPLSVDDSLILLSTSKGSEAIENLLQNEPPIKCDDSVKAVTLESFADYTESSSRYSSDLPDFSIQLQEDCVPGIEDPDQHELDISEAPNRNSSQVLSSEDTLYVSHSSRDSLSVSANSVSCTEFANPDLVDQTDTNLLISMCNSMPSEHSKTELHLHIDDENKVQEENERDFSSEAFPAYTHERLKDISPSIQPIVPDDVASRAQTGDEPDGTLAHQEVELLGHSVPFEITESALQDKVDYVELADKLLDTWQEQSSHIMVNCKNTSELDIPQSNTDIGPPDPDASVHSVDLASNISAVELPMFDGLVTSECSSENTQNFLVPNMSGTELPTFEAFVQGISKSNPQELSEKQISNPVSNFQLQDIQEAPPLPPLPPLEWRMVKLGQGSFISGGNFVQPLAGANPFSTSSAVDDKHPHDLILADTDITQTSNCVTHLPLLEERASMCVSKMAQPLRLSELPPIVENKGYQYGDQKHPLNQPSAISPAESDNNFNSHVENEGYQYSDKKQVVSSISPTEGDKNLNPHDASREGILLVSDASVSSKSFKDETSQHLQLQGEKVQHLENENPQLNQLLTTVELERSEHSDLGIETGAKQSVRPYLLLSSTEDNKYQYNFGVIRDETVQHLSLFPPLPTAGPIMPHYGFISSREEYPFAPDNIIIPIMEDGILNGKPSSIRNLPRHPLIDAVAAHDKSKLRKVSELIPPSIKPEAEERNTLLEQIRNKSFNLKPAAMTKPNIKGPSTNLKVAAILEKANAIRQACVGSDEDDEEGNWSDS